jgi:hypothetical protein
MMIVGQITSPEEAAEVEFIAKSLVVDNRIKTITRALIIKK